jgi:hypothetical protein
MRQTSYPRQEKKSLENSKNRNRIEQEAKENYEKKNLEAYNNLNIAIHNINGIKNNLYKLQELVEFSANFNFNVVDITETNIRKREAKYIENLESKYKS